LLHLLDFHAYIYEMHGSRNNIPSEWILSGSVAWRELILAWRVKDAGDVFLLVFQTLWGQPLVYFQGPYYTGHREPWRMSQTRYVGFWQCQERAGSFPTGIGSYFSTKQKSLSCSIRHLNRCNSVTVPQKSNSLDQNSSDNILFLEGLFGIMFYLWLGLPNKHLQF
jgi:hypothetical protein